MLCGRHFLTSINYVWRPVESNHTSASKRFEIARWSQTYFLKWTLILKKISAFQNFLMRYCFCHSNIETINNCKLLSDAITSDRCKKQLMNRARRTECGFHFSSDQLIYNNDKLNILKKQFQSSFIRWGNSSWRGRNKIDIFSKTVPCK